MNKNFTAAAVASLAAAAALVACGGNDDPANSAVVLPAVAVPATPFVVKLIGFNDYHGTLDVVGGSALYAWLLHAGGQPAIAQPLLDEAQSRSSVNQAAAQAADPAAQRVARQLLDGVQQQLRSGTPMASSHQQQPGHHGQIHTCGKRRRFWKRERCRAKNSSNPQTRQGGTANARKKAALLSMVLG